MMLVYDLLKKIHFTILEFLIKGHTTYFQHSYSTDVAPNSIWLLPNTKFIFRDNLILPENILW